MKRTREIAVLAVFSLLLTIAPLASAENLTGLQQSAPPMERRVFFSAEEARLNPAVPKLEVYTCDVLGSDSHLIVLGEQSILVDASTVSQADHVLEMLQKAGISHLTYAFNTHPHNDHAGGFPQVFEQVKTDELLVTWPVEEPDRDGTIHQRLIRNAQRNNIQIRVVQPGEILPFGDAVLKIVYSPQASSVNGRSALLQLTYHNTHMLFGADVTGHSLAFSTERYPFRAEMLKYPHHAVDLLPDVFWNTVQPEFAVVPHGAGETGEAQHVMDKRGIRYAFATHGIIHMTSDGEHWLVEQWFRPPFTK